MTPVLRPEDSRSNQIPYAPAITWQDLIELEPQLEWLERDIRYHANQHRNGPYCANRYWYGSEGRGFKDRLLQLVGWQVDGPMLRTSEAYDVAYDHLFGLLPDCRHERVLCS